MKIFTEPIFDRLAAYRAELEQHPLLTAARGGQVSPSILREFATYQYRDSILWIPMLAQMREKATRSERLRRAIAENIAHEAGLEGMSHVTLAVSLMRSLGVDAVGGDELASSASLWLSEDFASLSEPEVAGFLLTAETLVPLMFAMMRPAYERLGADTRYFTVHEAVDGDEHAKWMEESVLEVLGLYDAPDAVLSGMADAWEETIAVPDALWGRR